MSRHFILNSNYLPDPSVQGNRSSYIFTSREKDIPIKAEDKFVFSSGFNPLFKRKGILLERKKLRELPRSEKDKLINRSRTKKGLRPLGKEYEWLVSVEFQSDLKKPQLFSNLAYSLLFVENFGNPKEHLQRKIRLIPEFDFETIDLGAIYISRTAFGKLLNALPSDNRFEFRQLVSNSHRFLKKENYNFLEITKMLIDYINNTFISQGNILVGSKEILESKFGDNKEKIGLFDQYYKTDKMFYTQAKLFEPLLEKDILKLLENVITVATQNKELESRFREKFEKRKLPINFN